MISHGTVSSTAAHLSGIRVAGGLVEGREWRGVMEVVVVAGKYRCLLDYAGM